MASPRITVIKWVATIAILKLKILSVKICF